MVQFENFHTGQCTYPVYRHWKNQIAGNDSGENCPSLWVLLLTLSQILHFLKPSVMKQKEYFFLLRPVQSLLFFVVLDDTQLVKPVLPDCISILLLHLVLSAIR